MKTVALIQARLGSSRLPMKSLICLRGLPLIDWVVRRVAAAKLVDQVVVAVPDTELDRVLVEHLQRQGVACFRGAEDDVLARFYHAAVAHKATHVVRVCADNPLIFGGAVDELLRFYAKASVDYAYNHIPRNNLWPDGLGAETLSFALLEEVHRKAVKPEHREHCLSYIWDNADQYRIATFDPEELSWRRPELKLDIDTRDDYCRLARMALHPEMHPVDIIAVCDAGGGVAAADAAAPVGAEGKK